MLEKLRKFLQDKLADSAKAVLEKVADTPELPNIEEHLNAAVPHKSYEETTFEQLVFDPVPIPPRPRLQDSQLQAFTRKEMETAIQLRLHLEDLHFDFSDLEYYLKNIAKLPEPRVIQKRVVPTQGYVTREERRHLVRRTKKGMQRRKEYDNTETSK